LTAISPLLRVRPEIQEICRFAARREAEHQAEPLGWAQFHIVTKGRCFLEQRYGELRMLVQAIDEELESGRLGLPSLPRISPAPFSS
jgi:hypothetical protein